MEYVIEQDYILVTRNAQDFRGGRAGQSRRLARCHRAACRTHLPRSSVNLPSLWQAKPNASKARTLAASHAAEQSARDARRAAPVTGNARGGILKHSL